MRMAGCAGSTGDHAVAVVTGALALGGLTARFTEPVSAVVFGAYLMALVLLLATDLDQRLLPDVITLPAIPVALVFDLLGLNPLVPPGVLPIAIIVAIAVPGLMYLVSVPFGAGAFGQGDVKLLVSVGLLAGPFRMFSGRAVRGTAGGRRDRGAPGRSADHPEELHPVRAVPDLRRHLGDPRHPVAGRPLVCRSSWLPIGVDSGTIRPRQRECAGSPCLTLVDSSGTPVQVVSGGALRGGAVSGERAPGCAAWTPSRGEDDMNARTR